MSTSNSEEEEALEVPIRFSRSIISVIGKGLMKQYLQLDDGSAHNSKRKRDKTDADEVLAP
jgi:hypothetical protein